MRELKCNTRELKMIINIENGTLYYEDKDGNVYSSEEEYLIYKRDNRDQKLKQLGL
jgi:hypothetical protein